MSILPGGGGARIFDACEQGPESDVQVHPSSVTTRSSGSVAILARGVELSVGQDSQELPAAAPPTSRPAESSGAGATIRFLRTPQEFCEQLQKSVREDTQNRAAGILPTGRSAAEQVQQRAAGTTTTSSQDVESRSSASNGGRVGGISAVQQRSEEARQRDARATDEGLRDLQSLQKNADLLLKLARRVAKSGQAGDDEIKKLLTEYGLLCEDGAVPGAERASREGPQRTEEEDVGSIVATALRKTGASEMLVHDVFCLYNRLRGTDPVSPEQLLARLKSSAAQGGPVRVGTLNADSGAGITVVQLVPALSGGEEDESLPLASRGDTGLAALVEDAVVVDATELARVWNISLGLAVAKLSAAEKNGILCRDDTVEGLFFYKNPFVHV